MASDLSASAALVLGDLVPEGKAELHLVHHIDRDHEQMEECLTDLGAVIERVDDRTTAEVNT